jgi:hypothetical protein
MTRAVAAALGIVLSLTSSACELGTGCPTTVDEAAEMSFGDAIVGSGYAIRFIPSADPAFRGYDVNVTRPVSERATMVTYFLRTAAELPGVSDGDPVLLIGARTDRAHVVVAGTCPPLTVTSDEDVSWEANQP